MSIGSFCLVLHGHIPYVLRHGQWPHGEDWLYEAAVECYLPLLSVIDECAFHNAPPRFTIGLTPVLLEQLAHDDFRNGLERYLADRIERAGQDREAFGRAGENHMEYLARWWGEYYTKLAEQFADLGRDIPGAFAQRARQGLVQILTSAATHAYLPLLCEDSSIRAQLRAGMASSKRILDLPTRGAWLPECAYRGGGVWTPPVNWGGKDNRIAIEHLAADEGINHFFVEHHLIEGSRSEWRRDADDWKKVGWDEAARDARRGWQSVYEPHLVNSDGLGPGRIAAFGRDPVVCERVWSGSIGYPADGVYLEFHKKHGERRGLRYWKVTGSHLGLGGKDPYQPDDIPGKIHEHAQHFCDFVVQRLHEYHNHTGRRGVVTASFDAELFGHWWFEGPRFIRDVILTLNAHPDVDLHTTENALEVVPPDKTVALPEGSWGEKGDHRVWTNERVNWMWEVEYRCEAQFGKLAYELPWETDEQIDSLLRKAGRELLLLQASDWPFMISRGQAIDYGIKRFMQHATRFESLVDIAEKLARDSAYLGRMNEVEELEVRDAEVHDVIFPDVDLKWWSM